jgi:hypothetical protein
MRKEKNQNGQNEYFKRNLGMSMNMNGGNYFMDKKTNQ